MEESEDEVEADGAHVKQNRHNIEENDDDVEVMTLELLMQ